jgi:predicted phosphodiesterase
MRIAVLSDIHGNSLALDAALADSAAVGVDEYWILGDIVALGPDPDGVMQRLVALSNCHILRGNTDRYVVTGDRPPPYPQDLGQDAEMTRVFAEVAGTFAWTQGAVTATGWLEWLARLPQDFQAELTDGTKCLCVHARPGTDDGPGIDRESSDAAIFDLLKSCAADLICVGHTHQRIDRRVGRWHILNPGSISNPRLPVLGASYAILTATPQGYRIEHREVNYDREQVVAQLEAMKHPGANFIIQHLRGMRE